jgi:hypothetical protein
VRPRGAPALLPAVCALGLACGGGGDAGTTARRDAATVTTRPDIAVRPAHPRTGDTLRVTFPTPYAVGDITHNGAQAADPELGRAQSFDNYHLIFGGPGGRDCLGRYRFRLGYPAVRARARMRTVDVPPPGRQVPRRANARWCPGSYEGRVEFRQPERDPPIPFERLGTLRFVVAAGDAAEPYPDALALAPSPAAVTNACRRASDADGQPLPCPRELPRISLKALKVTNDDKRPGRCQTLLELGSAASGPFHLLFGARCRPFPLATRQSTWPLVPPRVLPDDLGLIGFTPEIPGRPGVGGRPVRLTVLQRIRVAGRPGLLLRVKPYPAGGLHGGHVMALWNDAGRGYLVSLHFEDGGHPGSRAAMEEDTTRAVADASAPAR